MGFLVVFVLVLDPFSVHRNLFVKKLTNKFGKLTHDFVAQI